jgi:alpha-pyrone synthase
MPMTDAFLNAIGTAVPPHDVHDAFVAFAATLLPDDRLRRIFGRWRRWNGSKPGWAARRDATA